MSEDRSRLQDDVTKNISAKLQEVLDRELNLAATVLEPTEMAMVTVTIARGLTLGSLYFIIRQLKDDADASAMFDTVVGSHCQAIADSKGMVLERAAQAAAAER